MSDANDFLMGGESGDADVPLRRVKIIHTTGEFEEVDTGANLGRSVSGVPLIVMRNRTLWSEERGKAPLCKSPNAMMGFPGLGFAPDVKAMAQPIVLPPSASLPDGFDSRGAPVLACEACPFAAWTTDFRGKRVAPACRMGYSVAFLLNDRPDLVTLIEFSGSAIRGFDDYMKPLERSRQPMFVAAVNVKLQLMARNMNHYSVPEMSKSADTDPTYFPTYAQWARWVRGHLLETFRPPSNEERAPRSSSSGFDGIL